MAAEEVAEHFGRNLVRLRRRVDLSQEELSVRASLHRTEIGLLERGLRLARADTVVKLAGGLEADTSALFHGLSWMPGGTLVGRFSLYPPVVAATRRVGK